MEKLKSGGKMDKVNKWKITAIIFIILFVLETLFVGIVTNIGINEIKNEEKCSNDICYEYDAYQYYENTCYCYTGDEVAYTRYLG